MFDENISYYNKIISTIGIIGYKEEDIINSKSDNYDDIPLNCLYSYPTKNEAIFAPITYEMMFPNGNHKVDCAKFFTLYLTNERGEHSFLYCLKFSEKFKILHKHSHDKITDNKIKSIKSEELKEFNKYTIIDVPLVICIKSEKNDSEPFREILYFIYKIIINDNINNDQKIVKDYKKIELINLFYFLFSLPSTPPHSQVSIKLNHELDIHKGDNLSDSSLLDDVSIDFYFSSNSEIPCNKVDTNIDLLFKIFDQTVIIKVLFAILTEKQIIFRASEAYLLHIVIPTFLKLIFPFVWIYPCITLLTKENLDYLDSIGSYIIGILSSTIQVQEILKEYPGRVIVDCDTNQIFWEETTVPFCPKDISNNEDTKLRNSKKMVANNGNELIQGLNSFIIEKSYLYENVPNFANNKKKLKIQSKSNIIIDIKKSQLLTVKSDSYINSEEWAWLRKNIQMVRNPEIFDIENIIKKKQPNIYFDNTKLSSPIIPEKSFSYNIQNIFLTFLLNKLTYPEITHKIAFRVS
jgi:hypothetical protein